MENFSSVFVTAHFLVHFFAGPNESEAVLHVSFVGHPNYRITFFGPEGALSKLRQLLILAPFVLGIMTVKIGYARFEAGQRDLQQQCQLEEVVHAPERHSIASDLAKLLKTPQTKERDLRLRRLARRAEAIKIRPECIAIVTLTPPTPTKEE